MPLTILHCFPTWLTLTQTWMHSQVHQLQCLGVNAHVVCERTENLDQFYVRNIHRLDQESLWRQYWDKGLRKFGIRNHLEYAVNVGRKIEANIVHSHFGNQAWFNIEVARRIGAKHVVTFYGMDVNKLPHQSPVWYKRYSELFSKADLFLCEGVHMAECLIAMGCTKEKIRVQHLGVSVDSIKFKLRRWRVGTPVKVLIAASFREKKGIPFAIRALEIVAKNHPLQLTIIGEADKYKESQNEKAHILTALKHSGLIDTTLLTGYLSHKSMMQESYGHDIFLQPSITARNGDTEGGAPVSIIEMLASGMPVVTTMHCDIPEVMGPVNKNLLAAERDVAGLVKCLNYLLGNPEGWLELAKKAREHIECEYDLVKQTERMIVHYNDLLENNIKNDL